MRACTDAAGRSRGGERGAILLVVLILSVTISLLAMALISTAEVTLRAQANAEDLDRAERGARSGVEWAAAAVKNLGALPQSYAARLESGVGVTAKVRLAGSPRLLGTGISNGVSITFGADFQFFETTRPYAWMSFSGTNKLSHPVNVNGCAYLGAASSPLQGATALLLDGDLDLVTNTTLTAGSVTHSSGIDNYGVKALSTPAWDTTPFLTAGNWTVPYTAYSGTTTLRNVTLSGIVVVTLAAGQTLTLDNATINGTLVVPWLYPPLLDLLGTPTIEVKTATIAGGTADTGNLAILAPGCTLSSSGAGTTSVSGVCYLRRIDQLKGWTLTGQMLTRLAFVDTAGPNTFTRPAGFSPNVPVGINWGGDNLVIYWRGRQ